jgi:predicted transcriptional regulator
MLASGDNIHCVMMTSSVIILYRFAMRTIIDLPDSQLAALRELEQRKKVSRAELIRQAVAQYVVRHAGAETAFGAWKTPKRRPADGLAVQKKLRSEWDR